MKNLSKILLILALFYSCVLPGYAEEPQLTIRLSPGQTSVKPGMMFLVQVQVSNSGEIPVDLWCHSCSYEKHWIADIPEVSVQPWTCHEDGLEKVTLRSGEAYEKNLILYITKNDGPGIVTFKLGFTPFRENGAPMEPVWSDPVTMKVWIPEGEMPVAANTGDAVSLPQTSRGKPALVEISESMPDSAIAPDDEMDPDLTEKISA